MPKIYPISFKVLAKKISNLKKNSKHFWLHELQLNDTFHNDILHNDILHNDT